MPNAKRKKQLFLFLFLGIACVFILIDVVRTVSAPTIYGTIVDEKGVPLDDVTVWVESWEPYSKLLRMLDRKWPNTPGGSDSNWVVHITSGSLPSCKRVRSGKAMSLLANFIKR